MKTVDVDQAKLDGNAVEVDEGAYVHDVSSGSPAARAGIQAGDVVVKVDGGDITSAASLGGVIRQHKPGDEVEIELEPWRPRSGGSSPARPSRSTSSATATSRRSP